MGEHAAPGWPGIPGRWTSGRKSGVGTALGGSAIWFTVSHGILNEVYAPTMDQAATRDLGLLVTGPGGFVSEEKRHAAHATECPSPGVPLFRVVSTCAQGRYRIEKEIFTDPDRPVVVQRIRFAAPPGERSGYRLYALLAPHLENHGGGNTGWAGSSKGEGVLLATRGAHALCLAARPGFVARSVGFVGASDGWLDLMRHGRLTERFDFARDGNVALTGELPTEGDVVLALAYGRTPEEAALQARATLAEDWDALRERYVAPWRRWHASLRAGTGRPLSAASAMVLAVHQDKRLRGAVIASLAVPWGNAKGDGDLGGYHLVWPRDMVEAAGGFLAIGAREEARAALSYLRATQDADGSWPQNMWTDGRPYWGGVQLDETALPILLVDLARREEAIAAGELGPGGYWPMVRAAAAFLVRNGPVTQQDRWEEDGGYTPFTLGAEIAALLAAADLAELAGEAALAPYLRETADAWNGRLERWLLARATPLARRLGIDGYYVRVAPPDVEDGGELVPLRNRPPSEAAARADAIVSADALALVRFGLRAPDDPRVRDTVVAIDALLRVDTPAGPSWRRYNGDGYGEHADGGPFDGTGIGRAWPLLTGERAHYALARGDRAEAERLAAAFERFSGGCGLLPEQIWDAAEVPARELRQGRPAGSAMPLVWAHAEYLKLARSLELGRVFDTPPQPLERYVRQGIRSRLVSWRFNQKLRELPRGHVLRVEVLAPASVRWSADGWASVRDTPTRDTGLGMHVADLPTDALAPGAEVAFTFRWLAADRWEGADFRVRVVAGAPEDAGPAREG